MLSSSVAGGREIAHNSWPPSAWPPQRYSDGRLADHAARHGDVGPQARLRRRGQSASGRFPILEDSGNPIHPVGGGGVIIESVFRLLFNVYHCVQPPCRKPYLQSPCRLVNSVKFRCCLFVRRFHSASNSSLSVNVMFMSREPLTQWNSDVVHFIRFGPKQSLGEPIE